MEVECGCVNVYVSIHGSSIKGGVAMTVAYCKKVHNFQMDSCKTCKKDLWKYWL